MPGNYTDIINPHFSIINRFTYRNNHLQNCSEGKRKTLFLRVGKENVSITLESSSANEILLWNTFRLGNRTAFQSVYQLYFSNLYEYGVRICNNQDLVKDSIQDLFVKIWVGRSKLPEVLHVKSYLLVSLRRTIHDTVKAGSRNSPGSKIYESVFEFELSADTIIAEHEKKAEERKKLFDALEKLTARQKEFIYLKYFEELSFDEIAVIMSITVKAAYKLSARSLEAFRNMLNISKGALMLLLAAAR